MKDSGNLRDFNPDRNVGSFIAKWLLLGVIVIVVLGVVGWALRWASVPGEVFSPENVREQWAFAYQYDESLQAAARQVCTAEQAVGTSESANERTQRRTQLLALEQNYARIQAEYNARLRNAFEAGLVAPSDVPARAPELGATKQRVCSP